MAMKVMIVLLIPFLRWWVVFLRAAVDIQPADEVNMVMMIALLIEILMGKSMLVLTR